MHDVEDIRIKGEDNEAAESNHPTLPVEQEDDDVEKERTPVTLRRGRPFDDDAGGG